MFSCGVIYFLVKGIFYGHWIFSPVEPLFHLVVVLYICVIVLICIRVILFVWNFFCTCVVFKQGVRYPQFFTINPSHSVPELSVRYYMKNKFSVLIVLYCTKKCNNNNYKAYPRPCFKSTRYIIQKFVYAWYWNQPFSCYLLEIYGMLYYSKNSHCHRYNINGLFPFSRNNWKDCPCNGTYRTT